MGQAKHMGQNKNARTKWLMNDFHYTGNRRGGMAGSSSSSAVSHSASSGGGGGGGDPLGRVGFSDSKGIAAAEAMVGGANRDPSLITKRSWDVALSPLKQVPQNLFLMWMSGNTISIFPIMMVGMLCMRPVQALYSVSAMFAQFDQPLGPGGLPAVMQKAVYLLGLLFNILLAMYKCSSMGLLPLHQSDWIGFLTHQIPVEASPGTTAFLMS